MPRAKTSRSDKKSNLGSSLQNQNKYKPKKDDRSEYKDLDRTEKNTKFTSLQNNQVSVTEQSDLQAFIDDAILQNRNFETERSKLQQLILSRELQTQNSGENSPGVDTSNINYIKVDNDGTKLEKEYLSEEELKYIRENMLTLPRRPEWNKEMSKDELIQKENLSFLEWRRNIATLEQDIHKNIGQVTPFEKNLEFWRQLWRVVEYSNIIIQILDARNPLLFYNYDLVKYVLEISARQNVKKTSILLLNKADLLSETQRKYWIEYFKNIEGISGCLFFSAKIEKEIIEFENMEEMDRQGVEDEKKVGNSLLEKATEEELVETSEEESVEASEEESENASENALENAPEEASKNAPENESDEEKSLLSNVDDLIKSIKQISKNLNTNSPKITVGLVGYPNVGKSSTINVIKGKKCVSVSATPGKTKHFQTINLPDDIVLYDCPGLVLPNTANTKAELVINGILSIDQLKDWRSPVNVICDLVFKKVFERRYGLDLSIETEYEKAHNLTTGLHVNGRKLLVLLAINKGFAVKGRADESRAARIILKEFVNGQLLYCKSPPNLSIENAEIFQKSTLLSELDQEMYKNLEDSKNNKKEGGCVTNKDNLLNDTPNFDAKFFNKNNAASFTRGKGINYLQTSNNNILPDKKFNRTKNKNKGEKARKKREKENDLDYF